jgi:hypothetical protein
VVFSYNFEEFMNFFVLNVLFLDNLDHFAIFYQFSLIILMAYDIYFDIILQLFYAYVSILILFDG